MSALDQSASNPKKARQSNFEILRIIAMLLIITHHFCVHGGIELDTFTAGHAFMTLCKLCGKIGVNLFVLISGYFTCKSSGFSANRVLKLLAQVTFYTVTIYLICCLCGFYEFAPSKLLFAFFPLIFSFSDYWFFTVYIIVYLCSPLLNAAVRNLSRVALRNILILAFTIYTVLPQTITIFASTTDYGFSQVIWFFTLYLFGAYVRLYWHGEKKYRLPLWGVLLVSSVAYILCNLITLADPEWLGDLVSYSMIKFKSNADNAIFPVLISISAFLLTEQMSTPEIPWINTIAKSTFGVYLIHDNDCLRPILWKTICKVPAMEDSPYLVPYGILCIILVFVICSAIDLGRAYLFDRFLFSSKLWNRFVRFTERIFTWEKAKDTGS